MSPNNERESHQRIKTLEAQLEHEQELCRQKIALHVRYAERLEAKIVRLKKTMKLLKKQMNKLR